MAKDIEVGDVVVLKSGGPAMTVGHIECSTTNHEDDQATCVWINEAGGGETYVFPVVCLRQH
jgi:uncharacterized protein YodC (DUF2158 family)